MPNRASFAPEYGSFVRKRSGIVLVVDDYDDARATMSELLEANGYTVLEASNGQEALNVLVSARGPQVGMVVLDLQMPVMDGFQFLKLLGNYVGLANIPVAIVSAHHPKLDEVDDVASARVVGRLQAPYASDELLAMVKACTVPSVPPPSA